MQNYMIITEDDFHLISTKATTDFLTDVLSKYCILRLFKLQEANLISYMESSGLIFENILSSTKLEGILFKHDYVVLDLNKLTTDFRFSIYNNKVGN